MSTFIIFLIIVILVAANSRKGGNQQKKTPPAAAQKPPVKHMDPAPKAAGAADTEGRELVREPEAEMMPEEQVAPYVPEKPTPHNHDYAGSLHAETMEGEEPADHVHSDEPLPSEPACMRPEPEEPEAEPAFSLNTDDMVRGFVVSEILKRPSERFRCGR